MVTGSSTSSNPESLEIDAVTEKTPLEEFAESHQIFEKLISPLQETKQKTADTIATTEEEIDKLNEQIRKLKADEFYRNTSYRMEAQVKRWELEIESKQAKIISGNLKVGMINELGIALKEAYQEASEPTPDTPEAKQLREILGFIGMEIPTLLVIVLQATSPDAGRLIIEKYKEWGPIVSAIALQASGIPTAIIGFIAGEMVDRSQRPQRPAVEDTVKLMIDSFRERLEHLEQKEE